MVCKILLFKNSIIGSAKIATEPCKKVLNGLILIRIVSIHSRNRHLLTMVDQSLLVRACRMSVKLKFNQLIISLLSGVPAALLRSGYAWVRFAPCLRHPPDGGHYYPSRKTTALLKKSFTPHRAYAEIRKNMLCQ